MRIAFLGTPAFAVPSLQALARAGHELVAVVAQPDRRAGRGQDVREPPTKAWARENACRVLQPEKIRDGGLSRALAAESPDLLVVVAYGRILGRDLLELAPHGAVNVHASLLPRYRGAAPIQWAIAGGEAETGVTIMQMDEGLDTGHVLLQRALPIGEDDAQALSRRLSVLGAEALVEALELLQAGRIVPVPQDPARATLAPVLTKDDGRLDFSRPAPRLADRVRAFRPWPGSFTTIAGRTLKVHAAAPVAFGDLGPGEARPTEAGLLVGCGERTALLLLEVQLEGKKRLPAVDFLQGHAVPAGTVLGP
ncbi:MAG TPA: methionyl-tRNA formyltransferase [Anaeromyxobacteraceae bacterium]|nr:methionyl-tRNA formyltransferase [Anaeromyxobacteraceae bacterium]